jgi:hypothetical protein
MAKKKSQPNFASHQHIETGGQEKNNKIKITSLNIPIV